MDIAIFYAINHLSHTPFLDELARVIHYATREGLIYYPFAIVLWLSGDPKKRRLASLGLITGLATYVINDIVIKNVFDRVRPYQALPDAIYVPPSPHSFSFPSGQAAIAFALTALFFLILPHSRAKYIMLAFALLVCLDRMYMAHHYPSDVLAGAIIGIMVAYLTHTTLIRKFKN